ncbi:MAG: 16S rRNA (guanine(966)-N(2))-methyltransferase RsmD [Alphaproteobacteria bacterium]|nr:16S rRNA (guanine(966)-N(2))-methyltransferase RsmD [Alphaproteobacteria bacterium]
MNARNGRIISGKYRGKKIPLDNNPAIRPTTDRVKETMFNILQHSYANNLKGIVLDLFAGSGSLGIECLSRGSAGVIFADKNPQAIIGIKKFVNSMNFDGFAEFITGDSLHINLSKIAIFQEEQLIKKISLVFLDPPYESTLVEDSLNLLLQCKILQEDCIFVVESSKDLKINNLKLNQAKIMGKTIIKIYQLK